MKKFLRIPLFFFILILFCQSRIEKENPGNTGSGISSIALSPQKIQDLALLGKTWGFIKYYHPAIAKGKYNLDNELFKIMPQIIACKNEKERNTILLSWTNSFGKVVAAAPEKIDNATIKINPDSTWINTPTMGDSLYNALMLVKNAKRKNKNFYVETGVAGNAVFINEMSYSQSPYPDAGVRLLALYRYWNAIQYFYPYKYLLDEYRYRYEEDWNDVLVYFIPKFVGARNELEYKLCVLELIGRLRDTHAVVVDDRTLTNYIGANYAPVELEYVENKFVVAGFLDKKLGEESGLKKGDVMVSVGNKKIEEIIKEKSVYSSASNEVVKYRNIAEELLRTNDTLLPITYLRGNSIQSATLHCYPHDQINMRMKYQRKDTCFKYLTPDIGYIYAGSIRNKYLPTVMPGFMKTKAIVIDLRCYPREFIPLTLGKYLWADQSRFGRFTSPDIKTPGLFVFTPSFEGTGKKNEECYKGKIIILVNEITQSQGEYTSMAFRHAPGAIIVGSTTAGADGNVTFLSLPGGITTRFSGLGVYWPDGRETQQVGIIPDVEAKPTLAGITAGRDEQLEKAMEIINGK